MRPEKEQYIQVTLVLITALLVYANALGNGFVYDDHLQILDNPWLKNPSAITAIFLSDVWGFTEFSASDYYRPLMHTLNLAIYSLFGPSRFFFHLASLILHAVSCLLLFLFTRQYLLSLDQVKGKDCLRFVPFCAAMLFAVYPANVEAVAWLGSTADLLYVLFCMGALWCHLSEEILPQRMRPVCYGVSLGLFFAATISKETAFIFPALLVGSDWARGRFVNGNFKKLLIRRYAGFVGVSIVSLTVRFLALGTLKPVANVVVLDVWGSVQALSWYLGRLIWPFQHNFYPQLPSLQQDGWVLYAGLPVLGLAVFCGLIWCLRKNRLAWVAIGLILLPLLPAVANYAIGKPVAERYLYFPAMGACLVFALLLQPLWKNLLLRRAILLVVLLSFAGSTFTRIPDFRNDLTIWGDTVRKSPQSAKALGWYATALFAAGRTEEGIEQTVQAIELGLKNSNSLLDMADALDQRGRSADVDRYFFRVIERNNQDSEAFFEVGLSYYMRGDHTRAIILLERARLLDPDRPLIQVYLARAYASKGDYSKAEQYFLQAIQMDPKALPELKAELNQVRSVLKE